MAEYRDHWIECAVDEIRIRGYYFPWGTKHIPYRSIRSVRRVALSATRGRGRIWGTANPRYCSGGVEGGGDRLDRLSLLVGDLVGDPEADGDQEIARLALGGADAAASNSERATVGSAGGHADPDRRAVEGGDVDLGPQHGLGPADLGLDGQVLAAPTEDRMGATRTTA
jgi:hypothetical protein